MGIDGSGVWDRGFGSNDKAATYHRFQCSQLANALSAVFAAPLRPFPPPFRSLLLYFSLDLNIQVFPFAPPLPASLLSYPCFLTACIFGFYLYSDPRNLSSHMSNLSVTLRVQLSLECALCAIREHQSEDTPLHQLGHTESS
jgi:hypothetical protein